jgi:pimeloyl-ACP methyl ester carboxylesterase
MYFFVFLKRLPGIFFLVVLFSAQLSAQSAAGQLIDYRLLTRFSREEMKNIFKAQHIPEIITPARYALDVYEVHYYTHHPDGRPVRASGMLFVPQDSSLASPLLIYDHGSYTCRDRTFDGRDEQMIPLLFAADGYTVICPDYIGMGEGEGYQLFLNAASEAGASVDMLIAVTGLLPMLHDHTKGLFLTGYSQGGHACMATYRLLQDRYKDRFPVTAASPMSGPYDVERTVYENRLKPNENPVYLIELFCSYYESRDSLQYLSSVLVPPYDSIIPPMMNGDWCEEPINACLPDTCYHAIQPAVFQAFDRDPQSPMRQYLHDNNVYDWRPESPTLLTYCGCDHDVPPQNSLTAYQTMEKNGSPDLRLLMAGRKFHHVNCASFTVMYTKMFFDGILQGKKHPRGPAYKRALLNIGKLFAKP